MQNVKNENYFYENIENEIDELNNMNYNLLNENNIVNLNTYLNLNENIKNIIESNIYKILYLSEKYENINLNIENMNIYEYITELMNFNNEINN